jgi:cytochrome P450
MSAASFGGSFNLVESDNSEQKDMFNAYLKRVAFDAILPFVKLLPFVPPSSSGRITEQVHEIVAKRRKEMKSSLTRKDILQILINMNADSVSFSEKHLREDMITFMIAGSDTTSLTATFTLLLLLNNQEKLSCLIEEIDASFLEKEDKITFAKTQDLPYLNAVINESMRVMPIITGGRCLTPKPISWTNI